MSNHQFLLQKPKETEFEVLRHSNDWLLDYRGDTYSDKLRDILTRGLFEEHSKKADIGYANIEKAVVFCMEPKTNEILGLGGSSLLREKKSDRLFESVLQSIALKHRKIVPDLILDNFGGFLAALFSNTASSQPVKNDANVAKTLAFYHAANDVGNSTSQFVDIKLGSGSTAPARSDFNIQTALVNAPESGHLTINLGAYTVSNTVIYQGDANPTGGSGTVNEIGTFGQFVDNGATGNFYFMLAHDAVTPGVTFVAGKLLRGAYTWQL